MPIGFKSVQAPEVTHLCRSPRYEFVAISETSHTTPQLIRTGKENAHARS